MSSWGCSKFQASEYSVIRHGASWPNAVYVIEEDGVAARSHTYSYTGVDHGVETCPSQNH